MEIDYVKLHEPYKGEHSPSPEQQAVWLEKQQFSHEDIALAMQHVYGELHRGEKSFADKEIVDNEGNSHFYPAGSQLDHYLRGVANNYRTQRVKNFLEFTMKQHNMILNMHFKLTFWKRVKILFTGRVA